jgi:hypothetical protein
MKIKFLAVSALLASFIYGQTQTISGFEDVVPLVDSAYNGNLNEGGRVSGAAHFYNEYNAAWGSWSGFAFSSKTDTTNGTWSNQYACIAGKGVNQSISYGVLYNSGKISFTHAPQGDTVVGFSINNSTYAYKTMLNGDQFSKKFGGASGNDTDWFRITISAYLNGSLKGKKDFYLADFRFANNAQDYIVKDWTWVDLSSFGKIHELQFSFESTDRGQWGINTPTYACIDSLVVKNSSSNFAPIARPEKYIGVEHPSGVFQVLSNDKDPGNPAAVFNPIVTQSFSMGSEVVNSNGEIVATFQANAYGWDTAYYSIKDTQNLTDTAWVAVLNNNYPKAVNDVKMTTLNQSLDISRSFLTTNDSDEVVQKLNFKVVDSCSLGSYTLVGDSLIQYQSGGTAGTDTITYEITDEYGLKDTAFLLIEITNTTSLLSLNNETGIEVFPNPAKSYIQLGQLSESVDYEIYSMGGNLMLTGKYEPQERIDVQSLPSGLYWIKWRNQQKWQSSKLVIQ